MKRYVRDLSSQLFLRCMSSGGSQIVYDDFYGANQRKAWSSTSMAYSHHGLMWFMAVSPFCLAKVGGTLPNPIHTHLLTPHFQLHCVKTKLTWSQIARKVNPCYRWVSCYRTANGNGRQLCVWIKWSGIVLKRLVGISNPRKFPKLLTSGHNTHWVLSVV